MQIGGEGGSRTGTSAAGLAAGTGRAHPSLFLGQGQMICTYCNTVTLNFFTACKRLKNF